MKIGHKLTLGFVGLALLIAALGYVSLRTSRTTLEKAIGENSADLAEQVLDKINGTIYHRIENIQAHATNPLMQEFTTSSNAQFENLPDPNGYIEQVDRDWVNGVDLPIISELTTNKLAERLKSLQEFYGNKCGYPVFAEIFVTNKFGVNVAQTNKTTDYYQADEDWWQIARRDGLFVSDVNYDESSGTFSTEIAVRIDDTDGGFLGVIKAVPNIKETINIINEAKLAAGYKTMQLHLVNKDAKIIYSTKGYGFLQDVHDQFARRFGCLDRTEHSYVIGEKGTLFAYAHSRKYRDFAGLGWTLIAEIDTAEIFAPVANLRDNMLLAGVAIMGLALLASLVTYRSIVIPIAELQNATIQIASGNLDTNLAASTSDEIGQLSGSFRRMAHRLKKTISDLNDEVVGRKQSEEKLRDNQQFLDGIFNGIQDGISVLDADLNIIKANSWMEKMYADTMPLVGKKCYNAYQNRTSACPGCPSIQTLRTGTAHTNIVPYVSEEQQKGWIELSAFPLKSPDGNVVGIIEHVKDITERKRTEDALRESKDQLKTILDSIQTGVFIIDPETHTIVDANTIASKLVGVPREQLVGSVCHKYICPAEKGCCPVTDLGQQVDNSERVLLTAKGEKRPIIKTVATVMLGGRKHLLESFIDVAEHKKAEQALRRSEQRFREVAENARECVWETDVNGLYTYANPVVKEMLGYDYNELVGKKCYYDMLHPDDHEKVRTAFSDLLAKRQPFQRLINRNIHKDGRVVWLSTSAMPIFDEQGTVVGYRGVDADITEQRKAEEALEKLNVDLEAAVQEMSRSNRQLQDFVHVAAHDLKTPVRGIGTLADWIVGDYGDKLDNHGREQVRLLKARVVRIDKLIDGMLQFSKIVRNRQNEKEIDLNSLVSEIIRDIKPGDTIEIAADSLPGVTCEQEHISRVFENLLSNAVAFMDKPKGLIKVGCVEQGDFWRFYICDNGPGIEQKYFERIFRIFQTLPTKDEPDTAGIGLAIARKVVEIYGGKIWVESQPGVGSTFFFTFPKQRKESVYADTKAHTAC